MCQYVLDITSYTWLEQNGAMSVQHFHFDVFCLFCTKFANVPMVIESPVRLVLHEVYNSMLKEIVFEYPSRSYERLFELFCTFNI